MESRAAFGAAAAIALTVTGGVSALFLTVGQAGAAGAGNDSSASEPTMTVEYVDQYGNPVTAPSGGVTNPAATPEIILVNPDGTIVDQSQAPAPESAASHGSEETEYEEYEYEEYEHEKYEYEEYEEAEHEEAHEEGAYEDD